MSDQSGMSAMTERGALLAANARLSRQRNDLRTALEAIAKQPKLDELEPDEGDVEAGYDGVVQMARDAVAKLKE